MAFSYRARDIPLWPFLFEFKFFVFQQEIKKKKESQGNYTSGDDKADHERNDEFKKNGEIKILRGIIK